jgi:hypothetical protein
MGRTYFTDTAGDPLLITNITSHVNDYSWTYLARIKTIRPPVVRSSTLVHDFVIHVSPCYRTAVSLLSRAFD